MGDTIAETTESPPRFSNKMVPNRNDRRIMQNKSMQRMNQFSPIQTINYKNRSPNNRGAIYMERPSGIRAAAADEAHEMARALAKM
jgi:hypothetical protein